MICCGGCGKVGLNESFVFRAWAGFSFAGAKHHQKKSLITFLAAFGSHFENSGKKNARSAINTLVSRELRFGGYPSRRSRITTAPAGEIEQELPLPEVEVPDAENDKDKTEDTKEIKTKCSCRVICSCPNEDSPWKVTKVNLEHTGHTVPSKRAQAREKRVLKKEWVTMIKDHGHLGLSPSTSYELLEIHAYLKSRHFRLYNGPNGLEKLHGGAKLPPRDFWQPCSEKKKLSFF